jgi:NADH:ubiquinone oxidoreductase subunit 4 (subunit M)
MYLSSLLLLPLIGSAVIAALPAGRTLLAKQVALGTSVLTAILGIAMALQFGYRWHGSGAHLDGADLSSYRDPRFME